MRYAVYKFDFITGVHLGTGALSSGTNAFCADTLYSALYLEAMRMDCAQTLHQAVCEGRILLSDGLPYMGDQYYVPKPMIYVEPKDQGNSTLKKQFKKMRFLPIDSLADYMNGCIDPRACDLHELGHEESQVMAAVRRDEDTLPYIIGSYRFNRGNGLYVICGYEEDEERELLDTLLDSLSYSGIGGKRGAGKGRFELHYGRESASLLERLQGDGRWNMLLSTALPREDEMERALENASYLMQRRSGFVASQTYAPEPMKKRDLYTMQAGSCFAHAFEGDVYDVSDGGSHPVYRYARAMFLHI